MDRKSQFAILGITAFCLLLLVVLVLAEEQPANSINSSETAPPAGINLTANATAPALENVTAPVNATDAPIENVMPPAGDEPAPEEAVPQPEEVLPPVAEQGPEEASPPADEQVPEEEISAPKPAKSAFSGSKPSKSMADRQLDLAVQETGEVPVIVILKTEAAESALDIMGSGRSLKAARSESLKGKKAAVAESQQAVLSRLKLAGGRRSALDDGADFRLGHAYSTMGLMSGTVTESGLKKLRDDPLVERVVIDGNDNRVFLHESVPLIDSHEVWQMQSGGVNLTGVGQSVCVIDTGVNYTHAALGGGWGNKVVAGYKFIHGTTSQDCAGTNSACMDTHGHGSHCAGIVASEDSTYKGVAPDAKIVAVKVSNSGSGIYDSDIIAGMDYCIANASAYNISVISLSIGGGLYTEYCDASEPTFAAAVNDVVGAGLLIAIASGNDYYVDAISAPACVENATSVTASNKTDRIADFANVAWFVKLSAPGGHLTGVGSCPDPYRICSVDDDGGFIAYSGTSMATPHAAAAAAILFQDAELGSYPLTPEEAESILNTTGHLIYENWTALNDTWPDANYSRINLSAAVAELNDRIGLVVTVNSVWNTSLSATAHTFNVTLSEAGNCTLHLNGTTYTNATNQTELTFRRTGLAGNYSTIYFNCNATVGGSAESKNTTNFWLRFDTTAPTLTVNSARNTTITTTSHTFSVTLNEQGNCTLSLNGTKYANSTRGTTITWARTLGQGNFTSVYYICDDVAGNPTTTTTYWLKVDSIAPTVTWGSWTEKNDSTIANSSTVSWTASETSSNCTLYVNSTGHTNTTAGTSFTHRLANLTNGNYTLYARCKDPAGNTGQSTNAWWKVDSVAPTITVNSARNTTITTTAHTFSVTLNERGNCTLVLNGTRYANSTSGTTITWARTLGQGNFTSIYYICEDPATNTRTSTTYWLKVDSVAPTVTWGAWAQKNASTNTSSATVSWTASETSSNCTLYVNATGHTNTTAGTSFTHRLTSVADGNWTLYARCRDVAGNTGQSTNSWWRVDATAPTLAWDWDDVNITTSHNSTTVNLNASESVNCTLNFNGTRYGHSAYDTSIDWVIPQQADGNYSTVNATCADLVNNRARTLASWWAVDATTADLQIGAANISLSDTTPQTGDTVTITPTMQNLGSTASGNFTVAFLVNGVESATTGNISILGRSTNTTTFSWEPESAINYNLTIVVDYYDNITESMESNNNATRSVTVSSRGGGNNKKGGGSGGGGGGGTTGGLITDLSKLIPQENGTLPGFGTQGAGSAAANGTLRVVFLSQPQEGAEFAVVVLDSSGNPVEGVTVTYGNQTAVTGSDGKVVFIGLPGSVGLSIAKSGYAGSVETVASAPAPAQQAPPAAARKKSKEDPMLMYSALAGIALLVIFVIYMLVIRPRRFR